MEQDLITKIATIEQKVEMLSFKTNDNEQYIDEISIKMEKRLDDLSDKMQKLIEIVTGGLNNVGQGFIFDIKELNLQQKEFQLHQRQQYDQLQKVVTSLEKIATKQDGLVDKINEHSEAVAIIKNDVCELKTDVDELKKNREKEIDSKLNSLDNISKNKMDIIKDIISKTYQPILYIVLGFLVYFLAQKFGLKINIEGIITKVLGG